MDSKKIRTRQEFNRLTNPKGKDFIIGLDIGYSGTKVFYETGYFCFPSYVKKLKSGMLEISDDKDILYKEDGSDDIYMIGYNAQNMLSETSSNDSDNSLLTRKRYSDKRFQIITDTAIALATLYKKDNRNIFIESGLPSSYVEGDKAALTKVLSKPASFSLKIGNGDWKKFDVNIPKENIHIIPQPSGTLYSTIIRNDGKYVDKARDILLGNVLVWDIGFLTGDLFGLKGRSKDHQESSDDVGMSQVLQLISKKILEDTGEDIKISSLQKVLEKGYFTCIDEDTMSSETKSITPYVDEAIKEVLATATNSVKSATNAFRGYDYLIITGGTGEAWYEDICEWLKGYKNLTIKPGNINDHLPLIYSNSRGYYMFRYASNKG